MPPAAEHSPGAAPEACSSQPGALTSGPFTILGSLPFSILPIWRAISVLPVPGSRDVGGAMSVASR